jgi:hypothetical protein
MSPKLTPSEKHLLEALKTKPQTLHEVAVMALTALTIQHHGFRKLVREEIKQRLARPTRTPEDIDNIDALVDCYDGWGADTRKLLQARDLLGEVGTGYTVTKEQALMFFVTITSDLTRLKLEEILDKSQGLS